MNKNSSVFSHGADELANKIDKDALNIKIFLKIEKRTERKMLQKGSKE